MIKPIFCVILNITKNMFAVVGPFHPSQAKHIWFHVWCWSLLSHIEKMHPNFSRNFIRHYNNIKFFVIEKWMWCSTVKWNWYLSQTFLLQLTCCHCWKITQQYFVNVVIIQWQWASKNMWEQLCWILYFWNPGWFVTINWWPEIDHKWWPLTIH